MKDATKTVSFLIRERAVNATGLVVPMDKEGESRQSDYVIREEQVEDATNAAFFRAQKT